MSTENNIVTDLKDGVLTITIDRPKANAINTLLSAK